MTPAKACHFFPKIFAPAASFCVGCASSPTLISEYQVRDYGLVIGSVTRKHRSIHGNSGTQCFCVNSDVLIDFKDRGGLKGFELLPTEHGDEDRYNIITTTSPLRWTPREYKDEAFDGYLYDPTDLDGEAQDYPALVNHLSQKIAPCDVDSRVVEDIVSEIQVHPSLRLNSWLHHHGIE